MSILCHWAVRPPLDHHLMDRCLVCTLAIAIGRLVLIIRSVRVKRGRLVDASVTIAMSRNVDEQGR